ncbi:hypothetical protein EW145_g1177 [Phellinidium pouzarii]|uniref:Conserved oligomeric Golgi complex subunit 2 n=1 Tax=Phellinidium pouzarii TaxID=167371 RepID=A0A4S4LG18_9AGAM|nr:hypothetical protein EW145_g1177 [Phellinidium pouzarii]
MTTREYTGKNTSSRDPYELDRLAEELAVREGERAGSAVPTDGRSTSFDLPQLQPFSHDNPYLTSANFNVEDFLLSRSYTSLPDLRTELREYLAALKEELVKLINDDYEAFISLSTDLRGEGDRLERIKSPLGGLRSQILESRNQLQSIQDSVKTKLERRAALRDEKALLQLLLKISDSITRLESLLLISSPPEELSSEIAFDIGRPSLIDNVDETVRGNRAKHLLRIATEYVQLLYHAEKALSENCAFVTEMQWRIERIKSTLSSDLEHHFATTLLSLTAERPQVVKAKQLENERVRHLSDLTDCLRAYDLLGLWRDAEDIIRREVVRVFVKKTIYPGCLSAPHSPVLPHTPSPLKSFEELSEQPSTPYTPYTAFTSKQNPFFSHPAGFDSNVYLLDDVENPLASLYNKVLRFISKDLKAIMEAADSTGLRNSRSISKSFELNIEHTHSDSMTEKGFAILPNVVWAEVSRAVMDDLGSLVFAAGKADEFRKNYETTQAFLRSLEYLAPSLQSVNDLRHHPSFEAFKRRWQLPVYFQLRWKDIAGRVEEALESKTVSTSTKGTERKDSGVAFQLNQSAAIWNALCKCWSAEIYLPDLGHRFWRLTLQLLKRYRAWLESTPPTSDIILKAKSPAVDKYPGNLPGSRSPTPAPLQDTQSYDHTTNDEKILYQCAIVMQDLREMEQAVLRLWKEHISSMLPSRLPGGDIAEQPENILKCSLTSLTDVLPLLSSQVEAILIHRCCDSLAPVKSLPGQFRATSQKHMPTKPNTGESNAKDLKEALCVPMSVNVVNAVSSRYMLHVSAMRKTEESLRRLRMGKRTGFSLFGGSSANNDDDSRDEERVRSQLILDVEAFGKDAESLGVDLDHSSAFKALNYIVHANAMDPETS